MNRRLLIGALLGTVLAAPTTAAHAARVELTASAGASSEEYIDFRAYGGESNRVQVRSADGKVTIVDEGPRRLIAARTVFGACRQKSARRVVCPTQSVQLALRDKNDSITFSPDRIGTEPTITDPLRLADSFEDTEGAVIEFAFVDAGAGDDRIFGSRFEDVIVPGPGRDKVRARAGDDRVFLEGDTSQDSIRGEGGIDTLRVDFEGPATVDLRAGTAVQGGATDLLRGFERVHGSSDEDTLLGSGRADALYGQAGTDRIDGRAGNDLVVGEAPQSEARSSNQIFGSEGDDFLDARNDPLAPTSLVDCGPGSDREVGEVDDRVTGCERTAFRASTFEDDRGLPPLDALIPITPIARGPDGAPTYELACTPDTSEGFPITGCVGTLALERPPVAGATGAPERLGSAPFALTPGERANVAVTLTPAGQAAIAAGAAVAVHVIGELTRPPDRGDPFPVDFGWQQQPLGGP